MTKYLETVYMFSRLSYSTFIASKVTSSYLTTYYTYIFMYVYTHTHTIDSNKNIADFSHLESVTIL